jgi:hypothetical protein
MIPGIFSLQMFTAHIGIASATPYIAFAWLVALGVSDWYVMSFKCPRCEKLFFRRKGMRNGFTSNCLNCGLPKWQSGGQSPAEYEQLIDPDDPVIGDQWKVRPTLKTPQSKDGYDA